MHELEGTSNITSHKSYNQHCFEAGFVWKFGPTNLVDFRFCQASSMVLNLLPRNWIPSSASDGDKDKLPKDLVFDVPLMLLLSVSSLILCYFFEENLLDRG